LPEGAALADKTKIEWADATANFWIGCTKVSPACDNCYAERDWDHRKHRVEWGPHGDRSPVKAGAQIVRKMQRNAEAFIAEHGHRPRIFVNSLSDFADNHRSIMPEWREKVWHLARECPDVILMILTKRPQNLPQYLPADWGAGYPNVWVGTAVENQAEADRRIPHLLATPAAVRWLSCEPLLGPVDLEKITLRPFGGKVTDLSNRLGDYIQPLRGNFIDSPKLDWIVVGGESGRNARPMHPDWARSLRDQCAAAGVPYFFKQWGESCPLRSELIPVERRKIGWVARDGRFKFDCTEEDHKPMYRDDDRHGTGFWKLIVRVGKKRAGRLLDGVEHSAMPEIITP
jgi:protein gp37